MTEEIWIAFRYTTVDILGLPSGRAQQVANDFAILKLSRHFNYKNDFIHCPSDFNSNESKSVWILCNFNVYEHHFKLNKIPVQF